MRYVVIARDGTDPEAARRRLDARPAHLEGARRLHEQGHLLEGGALLDADGAMIGSMCIVDFADRADLDAWLASDPYVTGDVWRDIAVHPYRKAV